jgi:hypothetical protein
MLAFFVTAVSLLVLLNRRRAVALSCAEASHAFAPGDRELPPFPAHQRVADGDISSPVDVVYVTAFPRNLLSSLRTLCYFASADAIGNVHLIVPDRMAAYFRSPSVVSALRCPSASALGEQAPQLPAFVWPESQIVRRFGRGSKFSGTTRQMTLKLAAASIVSTPFYIVMDSDVYARRPFSRADLFDTTSGVRARANIDQNDYCQPPSWFNFASQVLASRLVADTDAFCADVAAQTGFSEEASKTCPPGDSMGAPSWFVASGNATIPGNPFSIERDSRGKEVYGACRAARGHATHVTPMILSRSIVLGVLAPRLEYIDNTEYRQSSSFHLLRREAPKSWLDVLLDFHTRYEAGCASGSGRFYSWTEYSLYFVSAVASNAISQYHAFAEGGITSIAHSMMMPRDYEAADWGAIFRDEADSRPFFIVHSWFGKSVEETDAHMAAFVPTLRADAMPSMPPLPSPQPFY